MKRNVVRRSQDVVAGLPASEKQMTLATEEGQ